MSSARPAVKPDKSGAILTKARSPLAHLLHALNQPLTGLQCSLELSLVGPHTAEQYVRTIRDGLELTSRMRILVEAIRELEDAAQEEVEEGDVVALDTLLRETADELVPAAEARQIRFLLQTEKRVTIRANPRKLTTLFFRLLESALALAATGSALQLAAEVESGHACVALTWSESTEAPEHSPFSRPELGLLIASSAWKRAGGEWESERSGKSQTILLRMPLAADH